MRNTVARALLRQGLARSELARVSQDVVRPAFIAGTSKHAQYLQLQPCSAPSTHRTFHAGTPAYKGKSREPGWKDPKAKKREIREEHAKEMAASRSAAADEDGSDGSKYPTPNPEEPLDFADVKSRNKRHDEHFREALKKLKTGGRFNPDIVGALRVQPDRKSGATYPLKEVAQIVPRGGRTISILVHEEEYVKPIMSAIQASADFNQQPQRDPDNELELILKIEPERRDDLLKRVRAMCHDWRERVRAVRQKRDKLHTTWRKDGSMGPDLKRTADKELEKIIKAKMTEIDEAEKQALKDAETK
ncbi:ribosome recycling factor [Hypoxylon sp. FL1857]|nr:ribosome recycling factor [Hypoxylon sp. FL1857]